MSHYDRRPTPDSSRPSQNGRPTGAQKPKTSRPDAYRSDSRTRDDYTYPVRRQSPHRRRRKRHTGLIVFTTFLISFLAGAYAGVWTSARYDIGGYLPGVSVTVAPLMETALPTDDWTDNNENEPNGSAEGLLSDASEEAKDEQADVTIPLYEENAAPLDVTDEPIQTESVQEATPEPTAEPTPEPTVEPTTFATYQKGDTDEEIKAIQEKLIELGFLDDTADGMFGSKTETAIIEYQTSVGLEASGIADDPTQRKMFIPEPPPAEEPEEPVPVEKISLSLGERSVIDGYGAIQIDEYQFGYEVMPSNESEDVIPVFIETETADTMLLYLDGTFENLSDQPIHTGRIKFSIYTGSVGEYAGFAAFEMAEGMELRQYAELNPGERARVVLFVEVPPELSQDQEPIIALVSVENTVYNINLR